MIGQATAFFVVSSGRSGTKFLGDLLHDPPEREVHHEYHCTHVQPVGVLYYQGLISYQQAVNALRATHFAAWRYSEAKVWGDVSNKLSWLIVPLRELFPKARFVHLVRDGRKVVSSYLHKLGDEILDDRSTKILMHALASGDPSTYPPPDKQYWWTPPRLGTAAWEDFRSYDQFERICFQWGEVNREILGHLDSLPATQRLLVRLEDLVSDLDELERICDFLGIHTSPKMLEWLHRPVNVHVPRNFPLTESQQARFFELAGDMMQAFGYEDASAYDVEY